MEGLPPHDHERDFLFINNPCSDTTGGGRHPEPPVKGIQAGSAISVFGGQLACWHCTWIEPEVKRIKSLGNQSPLQRHPTLLYKSAGARVVWHHVNQFQPGTTGLPLKQERHCQPADELGADSALSHPTLSHWMTSSGGEIPPFIKVRPPPTGPTIGAFKTLAKPSNVQGPILVPLKNWRDQHGWIIPKTA